MVKMDTPKYSILIPVYNVERYIDQCMESVINQTYSDFEVIIIDDGSTDNSGHICDSYGEKDNRIKVYHQKNQGLMISRKNGILRANGEYCLFLDSDDYYDVTLLEEVDRYIGSNQLDLLLFNKRMVYKNDKVKEAPQLAEREFVMVNSEEMLRRMIGTYKFNSVVNKVVRRKVIVPYLDDIYIKINYAEDMLQSVNFIVLSTKIGILDKTLYNYRINNSSLVHNKMTVERIIETAQVEDKIHSIIENNSNISKTEMQPFYSNLLSNLLDSLYRLNNLKGLSVQEHIKLLKEAVGNETVGKYIREADCSRIPIYNRIRLQLLKKEWYVLLIKMDKTIIIIQSALDKLKKENRFD
jgi:glycosyltransferase involved in cell wall biosynthesis